MIAMRDEFHQLVRLVDEQRARVYDFGDVLVARAGTRHTATAAGRAGRRVEDLIEAVARELGLPSQTRSRFVGRRGETAPCDLAVPAGGTAARIVVAAKGNDSTGSKLTDAVREIAEMADKREARQYVMAVVDGIGWKRRLNDLRRIYRLRETGSIDGLHTLASLDEFRSDLQDAAHRLGSCDPVAGNAVIVQLVDSLVQLEMRVGVNRIPTRLAAWARGRPAGWPGLASP